MANPVWPITLPPDFLQGTVKYEPQENVVRTAMDTGTPKVRQRFTAAKIDVQGTIATDNNGCAALYAFWLTTCQGGAQPFDWHDPITQSACSYRWVSKPKFIHRAADRYNIDCSLEILP